MVAGNEPCPQPQTSEHLAAIEIMKLKHILILQNKIDLVKEAQAREQHAQILKFVQGFVVLSLLFSYKCAFLAVENDFTFIYMNLLMLVSGTVAEGAPVVPISAQLKFNIDMICEFIVRRIPIPERDFVSSPRLIIIRSFDVNKPGCEVDDLKGGVAGGSILRGVLRKGQVTLVFVSV